MILSGQSSFYFSFLLLCDLYKGRTAVDWLKYFDDSVSDAKRAEITEYVKMKVAQFQPKYTQNTMDLTREVGGRQGLLLLCFAVSTGHWTSFV